MNNEPPTSAVQSLKGYGRARYRQIQVIVRVCCSVFSPLKCQRAKRTESLLLGIIIIKNPD